MAGRSTWPRCIRPRVFGLLPGKKRRREREREREKERKKEICGHFSGSSKASELVRDDSEPRGTFLGLVQFPKTVSRQFCRHRRKERELPFPSGATLERNPRYPRHFRSTEKKRKEKEKEKPAVADALSTERILTSAASSSLLPICGPSPSPYSCSLRSSTADTRFRKRSSKLLTSDACSFTFFASAIYRRALTGFNETPFSLSLSLSLSLSPSPSRCQRSIH